jgi:hypothetical protein
LKGYKVNRLAQAFCFAQAILSEAKTRPFRSSLQKKCTISLESGESEETGNAADISEKTAEAHVVHASAV